MDNALKPCPFCGGKVEFQYEHHTIDKIHFSATRFRIACWSCMCATPWLCYEDDAVEVWNKRKVSDADSVPESKDVHAKGIWLNTSSPNQLKCSNCGVIHFIGQYPSGEINWCPNCGADMRGNKNG